MEITDVRVRLMDEANDRLRAFCSVTFDDQFVVRDIKIVDGTNGIFVAMPSRKVSVPCRECAHRNQIRARYCEQCGARMPVEPPVTDANGRTKQHRDIAHPITPEFRELLLSRIMEAYRLECDRADMPDYEPEDGEELELEQPEVQAPRVPPPAPRTPRAPASRPPRAAAPRTPAARPAPARVEPVSEIVEDESDELVAADEPISEYDALIAGLNPGRDGDDRGRRPAPPPRREPPRPDARSGPRERGNVAPERGAERSRNRAPAPRREEPKREESRREEPRREEPRRDNRGPSRPAPSRPRMDDRGPARGRTPEPPRSEEGFGEGVDEALAPPPPARTERSAPRPAAPRAERAAPGPAAPREERAPAAPPARQPEPQQAFEEDETPFGEGIA